MAKNTPVKKEEMWFIILAKSKIVRAFAVSCELILFIGGLWITLTVNDPSAVSWSVGPVVLNTVVMTAMGWAVDAALGESWLHVVIQHVTQQNGMKKWSRAVAIGISTLFIANIAYGTIINHMQAGDSSDGIAVAIVLTLTILRVLVGFAYITVRECQGWLTRHNAESASLTTPPALQSSIDQWAFVGWAGQLQQQMDALKTDLQTNFEKQLSELASNQKMALSGLVNEQRLAEFSDLHVHKFNLVDLQMQRLLNDLQALQAVDISVSTIDYDAMTQRVLTHLKADFDAWKQAQIDALPDASMTQIDAPQNASKPMRQNASKNKNDASTKILTMRQPSASTTDKKTRIHALIDKDRGFTSYYLASQVGCSEATARRIKNEYIDAFPDASSSEKNDASDERETDALKTIILTPDALRHDA